MKMLDNKEVWIELPEAENYEEAQENCDAVNKMLKKLGVNFPCFFAVKKQKYTNTYYNFSDGPSGQFTELSDRGKWMNLDYLAK